MKLLLKTVLFNKLDFLTKCVKLLPIGCKLFVKSIIKTFEIDQACINIMTGLSFNPCVSFIFCNVSAKVKQIKFKSLQNNSKTIEVY